MRLLKTTPTPLNGEAMKPKKTRRKAIQGKRRRHCKENQRQKPSADRQRGVGGRDEKRRDEKRRGDSRDRGKGHSRGSGGGSQDGGGSIHHHRGGDGGGGTGDARIKYNGKVTLPTVPGEGGNAQLKMHNKANKKINK